VIEGVRAAAQRETLCRVESTPMQTVAETIHQAGEQLILGVSTLLGGNVQLRDINRGDGGLVFIGPHYAFPDLPLERKRLQSKLSEQRRHFVAVVSALVGNQPEAVRNAVRQHDETVREVIEQTHCVWHATTQDACSAAAEAIRSMLEAIECLHDSAEGSVVLVPDTNALIFSPALHTWGFAEIPAFEMLLTPTVLSELDALKTDHRNPAVREKARVGASRVTALSFLWPSESCTSARSTRRQLATRVFSTVLH
jgi:hypothetical protein